MTKQKPQTCGNKTHIWAYKYTCKKCYKYPKFCWTPNRACICECKHNNFVCTICWKDVARTKDGCYWFASKFTEAELKKLEKRHDTD